MRFAAAGANAIQTGYLFSVELNTTVEQTVTFSLSNVDVNESGSATLDFTDFVMDVAPRLGVSTDDDPIGSDQPNDFTLLQNFPNPFNPSTNITFSLAETARVELNVYDITGAKVRVLVSGGLSAGTHQARFDASSLASGVYFYELVATSGSSRYTQRRKMILIK